MKRQIIIHHANIINPYASHFSIDKKGIVTSLIDESVWFPIHLTEKEFTKCGVIPRNLGSGMIGIILHNYGPLVYRDKDFYPITKINDDPVEYPYEYCSKAKWRNIQHWDGYPDEQLEALKLLLQQLCSKHNIPKTYNPDMWDVSRRALMGEPGIFCHCSFTNTAADPHPQHELVEMLKNL